MQDYYEGNTKRGRGINLKVMLDTNIFISMIFFPSAQTENHF